MAGPKAGAVEVTPRSRGDDPSVARYKLYRNPDRTYSAVFSTGPVNYQAVAGGPWLDKVLRFAAGGTRLNEQRSIQSDVSMATWQVGSGGNARWWVEFKETLTGKGIQFQLSFQPTPVPGTNELRFTDPSGTWSYFHTRTGGKMLGPATATAQGLRTFGPFPYALIGGADPLALQPNGSLQSGDVFYLPAPHINGADGMRYAQTSWQLDTINQTVSFTINDTGLPASAFPFRIDPSTSFSVAASGDDDFVSKGGSATYPPAGAVTRFTTNAVVQLGGRLKFLPTAGGDNLFYVRNGLLRFPTSALPDDAIVMFPVLQVRTTDSAVWNDDNRNVVAESYAWDGTDADYAQDAPTTGLVINYPMSSLVGGASNDIPFSDPSAVNLVGTTSLRFHTSGGQPTGNTWLNVASFDDATLQEPRLLVDYALALGLPPAGSGRKLRAMLEPY